MWLEAKVPLTSTSATKSDQHVLVVIVSAYRALALGSKGSNSSLSVSSLGKAPRSLVTWSGRLPTRRPDLLMPYLTGYDRPTTSAIGLCGCTVLS